MSKYREISYDASSHIRDMSDAISFMTYLAREQRVNYEPEYDFAEYLDPNTWDCVFSPEDCDTLNRLNEECKAVCNGKAGAMARRIVGDVRKGVL